MKLIENLPEGAKLHRERAVINGGNIYALQLPYDHKQQELKWYPTQAKAHTAWQLMIISNKVSAQKALMIERAAAR